MLGVPPDSPAAKAGLRGIAQTARGVALGDVIVGVDATKVDDFDDLYNALDAHHPGDKVAVKVRRGDDTLSLDLDVLVLP